MQIDAKISPTGGYDSSGAEVEGKGFSFVFMHPNIVSSKPKLCLHKVSEHLYLKSQPF